MRLFMSNGCTPLFVSPGSDGMGARGQNCPKGRSSITWITGVPSCRGTTKVGAGLRHLL